MSGQLWLEAGAAAGVRASECRRRAEELRKGVTPTKTDAEQARARLTAARARAERASERLHASEQVVAGRSTVAVLPVSDPLSGSYQRMVALGSSVKDLWVAYVGLGGSYSTFDVDAAIHGMLQLPDIENKRLDQAIWEMENCL